MPYVDPSRRNTQRPVEPGGLHYNIALLINEYLYYRPGKPFDYQAINDVMGVLACAQQELYRRVAAPYEDIKRKENGDVYNAPYD